MWLIECFHITSRRPYWCPKPVPWELNSFLMQTLSFVPINLHIWWPREWKHSIGATSNLLILFLSICQMLAIFFWSWILSKRPYLSTGKEKGSRCLLFTSPTKPEIRHFPVVVARSDDKEMYKKAWCTCRVVFCLSNLLLELPIQIEQRYDKEGNNYSKNMNKRTDASEWVSPYLQLFHVRILL